MLCKYKKQLWYIVSDVENLVTWFLSCGETKQKQNKWRLIGNR